MIVIVVNGESCKVDVPIPDRHGGGGGEFGAAFGVSAFDVVIHSTAPCNFNLASFCRTKLSLVTTAPLPLKFQYFVRLLLYILVHLAHDDNSLVLTE
jgi:hypothetical protein